jgi:thiol:disulfide interchange protein/DsbC/DsbD-like thiol-disulfide interchange protein
MRNLKWWLLCLALFAPAVYPLSGSTVATDNVRARLLSEQDSIAPGQSIWVALELDIRDGWHTYWRNPGDSGQATQLVWSLPAGLTAGGIEWTTPHRFVVAPLVNYGYAKHAIHLVKITASPDLKAAAPLDLKAKASWLVCADVCIPESADLGLKLPVTAAGGPKDPAVAALFDGARSALPGAAPAASSAKIVDGQLVITLGKEWGETLSRIKSLAFYPFDDGVIEYAAPQTLSRRDGAVDLAVKVGYRPPSSGDVRGILIATEEGAAPGRSGAEPIEVPVEIAATFSGAPAPASAVGPRFAPAADHAVAPARTQGLPGLMLLAVLGGLILNLMPCVFPVLSIKAIGLVEQAKKHPAAVRAKGLMFAAGVIASMLLLAGVLLALRAGGEEIGWGFQLQSPLFVTFMVYLLLAVGLNLSGVFEVGGGLAGIGDSLTHGDSLHASFFTGVLTTLVATPCSAPFMAVSVGYALTQPPLAALSIFTALGVGLSLPYLSLSFAPWLRRALPKPGAWMDTMKQIFAFPMYASAAWLLWVLAQQTSSLGLGAALAGALLVAFAAWAYEKSKGSTAAGRLTASVTAAAAVLLAIALPVRLAGVASAAAIGAAPVAAAASSSGENWQPYDAARVQSLEASGAPLLVNFTASWCLTCLVNERNAFADPAVLKVFRQKGVTLMKGDWTNRDAAITQALSYFGRAGVPLYVVYNGTPGSSAPVVLPQLLSAGVVESAFAALPDRDLK